MNSLSLGRVVAVVVTYNRAELLQKCLDGLANQTQPLAAVVVIDNASTDTSGDVARAHRLAADVITLEENLGGAGGFAAGMARAMARHNPDWVWLMDDDTVPLPGAVAGLAATAEQFPYDLDVLSSTAVWVDGRVHPMNVSRPRIGAPTKLVAAARSCNARVIRTASFVAFAVRAEAVRKAGLPWADYFIWGDDTEYSARVLKDGTGLQAGDSLVEHHTARFGSWQSDPGPRFFYDVRNKLWLFTRTSSFHWWEKVLYGGSAALGWVKSILRSGNKLVLARHGLRGIWAAVSSKPRPTAQVLANESVLAADLACFDELRLRPKKPAAGRAKTAGRAKVAASAELLGEQSGVVSEGALDDAAAPTLIPVSVLLPVYAGTTLDEFELALASMTTGQVGVKPAEVVIVQDGPVAADVAAALQELQDSGIPDPALAEPIAVRGVKLATNQGLTGALNAGLEACTHDVVARMDADDFAEPNRLAVQYPLLAGGLDLVGSAMREWDGGTELGELRERPTTDAQIRKYAAFHNPFHHPSVMYRKSAVLAVGGYDEMPYMEDYWLFVRMIAAGAKVANSPQPLVRYRVDRALFERRGGLAAFKSDLNFQAGLYDLGLTNRLQYVRNLAQRAAYRVVPARIREAAYRTLVNRKS